MRRVPPLRVMGHVRLHDHVFDGAEHEHVVGQLLPVAMSEYVDSGGISPCSFPVAVCRFGELGVADAVQVDVEPRLRRRRRAVREVLSMRARPDGRSVALESGALRGSAGVAATLVTATLIVRARTSARSPRTARRLAVDSERAVARASSPRPIDILVRISLYERTGSRPTAPKNPVSSSVVWPCTPDQTASPAVVTSSTSHRPTLTQAWMRRRSDTKVDLAASRSADAPEPERGKSRTEHHRVQVGFAQREAAVAPEVGHPVGDGIVSDRAAIQLGSEIFDPRRITCRVSSSIPPKWV